LSGVSTLHEINRATFVEEVVLNGNGASPESKAVSSEQ
jgi:hypothetical protein